MTPLLALWQFGSAGMLAWGAAAAIPVLIHLWSRRNYRPQAWAAMSFLLAAMQKDARRMQFQQWILLAVRTAILALFVLALADPRSSFFAQRISSADDPAHVILVIDGSYSMDYRRGGQSRFEAAKQWAKQLVNDSQQGNGYTLVLMADPPQVVIGQPVFEKQEVLEEINRLVISKGGASLTAMLTQVEAILHEAAPSSFSSGEPSQRKIYFLSDLQQATWGEVDSSDCRARLARLESVASLELVDLGQSGDSNLAVTRLAVDSTASGLAVVGSEVHLQADIQNFGDDDCWQLPVEIFADGQPIADERVDCKAGGRATVGAAHRFASPGEHIVEVRLKDDALALDNRRWLVLPVRETIRVLCIGGRPAETKHVAMALAPHNAPGQAIEAISAPESRLLEGDLAEVDCVVLCNIDRFTREEAAALHRFASRGGGLMVFLGDEVHVENYNQLLVEEQRTRVLPARLNGIVPTDKYHFDPLEYRHPIVAPFRGFPKAGLLTTPIWRYIRVTPLEGSQVALRFDSGDPAIIEGRIGGGRCILTATAASPDAVDRSTDPPTPWTALPTWPSFPPLIHEMLRLSIADEGADRNVLVGEELSGIIPAGFAETAITLTKPSGARERAPIRLNDGLGEWSFASTLTSGIYEAGTGASVLHFAVNVNIREADLSRLDANQLPAGFHHEVAASIADSSPFTRSDSARYFRWLLCTVLAVLVIESSLAWRFERGRR